MENRRVFFVAHHPRSRRAGQTWGDARDFELGQVGIWGSVLEDHPNFPKNPYWKSVGIHGWIFFLLKPKNPWDGWS